MGRLEGGREGGGVGEKPCFSCIPAFLPFLFPNLWPVFHSVTLFSLLISSNTTQIAGFKMIVFGFLSVRLSYLTANGANLVGNYGLITDCYYS